MEQLVQVLGGTRCTASLDVIILLHHFTAVRTAAAQRAEAARLQHVQLAVLERELDCPHVPEVTLELLAICLELAVHLGELAALQLRERSGVRAPETTSSPCALVSTCR